jgi:hypothetical protein
VVAYFAVGEIVVPKCPAKTCSRVSHGVSLRTQASSLTARANVVPSRRARRRRCVKNDCFDGEENDRESAAVAGRLAMLMRLLGAAKSGVQTSCWSLCRKHENDRRY